MKVSEQLLLVYKAGIDAQEHLQTVQSLESLYKLFNLAIRNASSLLISDENAKDIEFVRQELTMLTKGARRNTKNVGIFKELTPILQRIYALHKSAQKLERLSE